MVVSWGLSVPMSFTLISNQGYPNKCISLYICLFVCFQSAAAAPSPVLGNIPPNDGMPGGPIPPGFFQVRVNPPDFYVIHWYLSLVVLFVFFIISSHQLCLHVIEPACLESSISFCFYFSSTHYRATLEWMRCMLIMTGLCVIQSIQDMDSYFSLLVNHLVVFQLLLLNSLGKTFLNFSHRQKFIQTGP